MVPNPPDSHQRARGRLTQTLRHRDGTTGLETLYQQGCLKARFPRPVGWHETVLLNTAGGVAGGDRLAIDIGAGPGTRATVTTQAAERFYRAIPGSMAYVTTALTVAGDAALEWLPQETILFDRCALDRTLTIDLVPGARFLGIEQLVFGRSAMGETVQVAEIRDRIVVRQDGRLLLHDATRLVGPVQAMLDRPACAAGARAVATIVHAGPGAAAMLDPLRAALGRYDAGASVVDGLLIARIVAANGACLRAASVAGLAVLRGDRPLPRVWEC